MARTALSDEQIARVPKEGIMYRMFVEQLVCFSRQNESSLGKKSLYGLPIAQHGTVEWYCT